MKVGILGNGTVGSGVVELIQRNVNSIQSRTGTQLVVTKVLVKDTNKHRKQSYFPIITGDVEEFFQEDPDIVVEAIGGMSPAYELIKRSLLLKKHVVTANKNVISKHGTELVALAKKQGVALHFEASVGGGMPVIRIVSEGLTGNNMDSITGILNGTTNYILSRMGGEGLSYDAALKAAQQLGFAEADPSSDVLGLDSARKLAITASIAFGNTIDWEKIPTIGITELDELDTYGAKLAAGTIKLLALGRKTQEGLYAGVRPVIVSKGSSLGKLENEFNGVLLTGDATGEIFLSGKGAGKLPTASAVMADILSIISGESPRYIKLGGDEVVLMPKFNERANWMIRIQTREQDRAKVFAQIAGSFRKLHILNQRGRNNDEVTAFVESPSETYLDEVLESMGTEHRKLLMLAPFRYH